MPTVGNELALTLPTDFRPNHRTPQESPCSFEYFGLFASIQNVSYLDALPSSYCVRHPFFRRNTPKECR